MSEANTRDRLAKACAAGEKWACELLGEKNMAGFEEGFKDGGLLADASRTWRMEAEYPEFEKGVADRLSKERIPEAEIEEQFDYSPLQRGYQEGGEVDNFMDDTGSMLAPEAPLNFEDEMPMDDEMMMEDEMMTEEDGLLDALSPEESEVLFQAMSDYPELEGILNALTAGGDVPEVFDDEGSVEGAGTGTSDSIPAKLSDGEFVFTAKAVKQLGVEKLRTMMAKAEEAYDEGAAKQEYAQMGDEGFAAGGLLTKPKYGSYSKGDIVQVPLFEGNIFEGQDFSYGEIMKMASPKRFGKEFLKMVTQIGNTGRYRVKSLRRKHGGEVNDSILGYETGGMTRYGKSVMTDYYHPFKNKRERDEAVDMIDYARFQRWLGTKIAKYFGLRSPTQLENDRAGTMRHDPDLVYRSGKQ